LRDGLGLSGRPGLRALLPEVDKQLQQLDLRKLARRQGK
jgi:hypothetical protein